MANRGIGIQAAGKTPRSNWHPADNMNQAQCVTSAPPPMTQPVNTAILLNQVQDATRSAKVRLRNLVDAIVGNEPGGEAKRRWWIPPGTCPRS